MIRKGIVRLRMMAGLAEPVALLLKLRHIIMVGARSYVALHFELRQLELRQCENKVQ